MSISFEGIGEMTATFLAEEDSQVKPGDVVCLTGNGQVGLGKTADVPCGVAATVSEDGCVGVQIGGLAEVTYSGSAPTVGWNKLSADGEGSVSAAASADDGMSFLVVRVDTGSKTAVVKL